jgi:uncharacterized protein (TIGR02246 family)
MKMPLPRIALGLFAFAVMLPAFAAGSGIEGVDEAWRQAMLANDLEAVMKTYAPDAVAWLPGSPEARGEKAIRAEYKGLLEANTVKEVIFSETGTRKAGKSEFGWGRFKMTLAPKAGGPPLVMTGRFTELAEQRNGKWVYVVDHASADPPPPAK